MQSVSNSYKPGCNRWLSGGSAHGNVVLIHIIIFRTNTTQRDHAFVKLTEEDEDFHFKNDEETHADYT